jgi:hypothetical protein
VSPAEISPVSSKSLEEIPESILPQLVSSVGDKLQAHVKTLSAIAISGPNHLDLRFAKSYDFSKRICEKTENREQLQRILSQILGVSVQVSISFLAEEPSSPTQTTTQPRRQPVSAPNPDEHPFVNRVMQVFGASLVTIESHLKPVSAPEETGETEALE